jgi:hypothetical protein
MPQNYHMMEYRCGFWKIKSKKQDVFCFTSFIIHEKFSISSENDLLHLQKWANIAYSLDFLTEKKIGKNFVLS